MAGADSFAESKLHGGVITDESQRTYGTIQLLSLYVRDKIQLTYYDHPNHIEMQRAHQFIIVLTLEDLRGVLFAYASKHRKPPLIIHLDRTEVLDAVDYAADFPDVEIVPVEQATLTEKDVTLQLDAFKQIMDTLESRWS